VGRGADRGLYLAHVADVDDWPGRVEAPAPHFVVLLAMDATSVDDRRLAGLAAKLMDQGMVYLCAWGPGCERVHDAFDDERTRRGETDDDFVPTTWFDDEALDDALWYAVVAVAPVDRYYESCRAVLVIVVAQPEWRDRARAAFADFDAFSAALLEREFGSPGVGQSPTS
jgi:hypothetical protein